MNNRIEVLSIEFRNLFSYGNRWQKFELKPGISFITGLNLNNDRRNFTGKSNLLKIFPYAQFGKVEGKNKNRIINWKNRKNAEVYYKFKKNDNIYTIHRGIKPDILEVYENDILIPVPPNKKDFQQQIENEILEMDYTSFMNTVYADTNNTSSIFSMSKPNKRTFLDQMFDLSYYNKLKEKSLFMINESEKSIHQTEKNVESSLDSKKNLNDQIQKFESDLNNVPDSKNKIEEYKNFLSDKKQKYEDSKNKLEEMKEETEKLKKQKNDNEKIVIKIDNKIREIKRNKIDCTKIDDSININQLNSDIQKLKKEAEEIQEQIPENIISYDDTYYDNLNVECTRIETDMKHLERRYKETKSKLDNKIDSVKCPTCFQKVDHSLVESHFKKELESASVDYESVKKKYYMKLTELNIIKENKEKEKEKNKCLERIEKKNNDIEDREKKKQDWQKNQDLKSKREKYKRIIEKLSKVKDEYSNSQIETRLEKMKGEIENFEKIIDTYEKTQTVLSNIRDKVESEENERQRIRDYIKDNENKIKEIEEKLENLNKSLKTLKRKRDYLRILKDLCGDEEARQFTISNKLPLLNRYVNDYLSKTGVNYYVKMDNWLDIEIKGPGIKECTYSDLSGAEKVSIDRALQFSFNDTNKLQSSSFLDILILDELLDTSVDYQGLQNIMEIIKTKQENDNSKILIVSHREGFSGSENLIDRHYCVEYNGYSQLKEGA